MFLASRVFPERSGVPRVKPEGRLRRERRRRIARERSGVVISALDGLDGADGDLAGLTVFLGIEGDLLTLGKAAHASALESGGVYEHILAAVIRLNEAEAFLIVVELYGARNHRGYPFTDVGALEPTARNCPPVARFIRCLERV
jgi:hypothetical protein